MIEAVEGVVVGWDDEGVLMRVGPVDARLRCAPTVTQGLVKGMRIRLRTLLEPGPQGQGVAAYAFRTEAERSLFLLLKEIQMVGPRIAIAILAVPLPEILRAVDAGDAGVFEEVKGVGPKLARRVLSELTDSDRLKSLGITPSADRPALREALDALVGLGFSRPEARERLEGLPDGLDLEELVRRALGTE